MVLVVGVISNMDWAYFRYIVCDCSCAFEDTQMIVNKDKRDEALETPVVSDETLALYAEAYQARRPLPYSFLSFVAKCEHIRQQNYDYEYDEPKPKDTY